MRCFLYLLSAGKEGEKRTRQHPACQAICTTFSISPENVVIENVDTKQPFSRQRLLKALVTEKMYSGDTLILTDLGCLGRNIEDIESALFFCFIKEINIYCYHPHTALEPETDCCMSFLITLQKKVDIHNLKATRSRSRVMKVKLGRKEGSKHKRDIITLKNTKHTQSQTAKKLGISLSTVKRHWSNGIIN